MVMKRKTSYHSDIDKLWRGLNWSWFYKKEAKMLIYWALVPGLRLGDEFPIRGY